MKLDSKLLVTGASGQLSRRVIHHLLDTLQVSPHRLIATTRRPQGISGLVSLGVDVRAADFASDVDILAGTFLGASRILLVNSEASASGVRLEQYRRAIAAAEKAGASHVVYTLMSEPNGSLVSFAPDHMASEAALAARAAGEGKLVDITRDDIARAAATILASTGTAQRTRSCALCAEDGYDWLRQIKPVQAGHSGVV